jgi:hypothetical protein
MLFTPTPLPFRTCVYMIAGADVGMAEELLGGCVMFLGMIAFREEHQPPHKVRRLPIADCRRLRGFA